PRPEFDALAIAWAHDDAPGVRWYPSSPESRATALAARALMEHGAFFGKRVQWALERIADACSDGVLCVDLPPGMFGVSTRVAQRPGIIPVLVTTGDRSDLYRSVHEYIGFKKTFPLTRWFLNRSRASVGEIRADLRAYLGNHLPGVEHDLQWVGYS